MARFAKKDLIVHHFNTQILPSFDSYINKQNSACVYGCQQLISPLFVVVAF